MSERKNEIFSPAPQVREGQPLIAFDVPIIDVPLPSKGIVYPVDGPLHGLENVTITAMTAAQENILTNRSLAKRGTLLTHLINSCLKDKAIDSRNMLIGDRNTLMIAIRISGYTAEYAAKVTCPLCDEQSTQKFQLNKLPVRELTVKPVEVGMNLFEYSLPMSKARVRFRFLTGADEEELTASSAQKKKVGLAEAAAGELVTQGLLQTIVSINGVTDRNQIALALPKMPAFDSQSLRKYIQDNEPGMQLKGSMVCPACDHVGEVDMPLGASFFWPGAQ